MTMQAALGAAYERGCWARPTCATGYAYRYRKNGKQLMLAVSGRSGRRLSPVEEFNPTLSRKELEDEWMLCEIAGDDLKSERTEGLHLEDLAS